MHFKLKIGSSYVKLQIFKMVTGSKVGLYQNAQSTSHLPMTLAKKFSFEAICFIKIVDKF